MIISYWNKINKSVNKCYGVIVVALGDHRLFNEKVTFWGQPLTNWVKIEKQAILGRENKEGSA